jgi:hypothetical protein
MPGTAPQEALDFLAKNPTAVDQFQEKYGYVPPGHKIEAPKPAVDYLTKNPDAQDQFQEKYGYIPAKFASSQLKGRTWSELGTDAAALTLGGFAGVAGDLAWLADTATFGQFDLGVRGATDRAAKYWDDKKSLQLKTSFDELGEADGFIETLGAFVNNPLLLPELLLGSAAYMLPTGAASRLATIGKGLSKVQKAVRATNAAASTGAALEGASAGRSAEDAISDKTPQQLFAESDQYRNLLQEGKTPEEALESIRKKTGLTAFAVTVPIAYLASVLTGSAKLEADFFTGNKLGNLVTNLGKEGAEEFVQEGGGQFGQNVGTKLNYDSTQALGDRVLESGTTGMVAGVGQAGAMHAGRALMDRAQGEPEPALENIETPPEQAARLRGEITQLENERAQAMQSGAKQDELSEYDDAINSLFAEYQRIGSDNVELNMAPGADPALGAPAPGDVAPALTAPVETPEELSVKAERFQGIDGLILTAKRMEFEEEAIRLETAKRLYTAHEKATEEGDTEMAARYKSRADKIYADVTGETGKLAEISDQFPAPYSFDGTPVGPGTDVAIAQDPAPATDDSVVATQGPTAPAPAGLPSPVAKIEDSGDVFAGAPTVDEEFAVEPMEFTNLADINLTDKYETEQGEVVEVTQTAEAAVKEIDTRIDALKALISCLRSGGTVA